VLDAREYVDCREALERGRAAMAGLNKALKTGDLDAARALTFDGAIALQHDSATASRPVDQPTAEAAE
jgi:hypothetical protein